MPSIPLTPAFLLKAISHPAAATFPLAVAHPAAVARQAALILLALGVSCGGGTHPGKSAPATDGPAITTPAGDRDHSGERDRDENSGFRLMRTINFGGLRIGLSTEQTEKLFGPPGRKTPPVFSPASGDYSSSWTYPKRGIEIVFDAPGEKKPAAIGGYTLKTPCKLRSTDGIGIGSTRSEIEKHYGYLINAAESRPDNTLVLGSVYGGVIFTLEKGKVVSIFVGAAAE